MNPEDVAQKIEEEKLKAINFELKVLQQRRKFRLLPILVYAETGITADIKIILVREQEQPPVQQVEDK